MDKKKLQTLLFGEADLSTPLSQRNPSYHKIARNVALCGVIFSLFLMLFNLRLHHYGTLAVTFFVLIIFSLVLVLFHKNKDGAGRAVLAVGLIIPFCLLLIFSLGDGFAATWSITIPLAAMWLVALHIGLYISLGFLGLLVILFYTPLRQYLDYPTAFMDYYPLLFLFVTVLSLCIMREYYTYQHRQYIQQENLKHTIEEERRKAEEISLETILSICNAVEAKDAYTNEHSQRVAYISCMIAQELGWPPEQVDVLHKIALLHDIGKIGVPDSVLKKPERLTDEEYEQMKQHTFIGAEILKELTTLPNVALGAKYHHERYDGTGYPNKLTGEDIPIEARIIGVADAFDAMNSQRIYRELCDMDYVFTELERGRGTQFDPAVVDALLRVIGRNPEET